MEKKWKFYWRGKTNPQKTYLIVRKQVCQFRHRKENYRSPSLEDIQSSYPRNYQNTKIRRILTQQNRTNLWPNDISLRRGRIIFPHNSTSHHSKVHYQRLPKETPDHVSWVRAKTNNETYLSKSITKTKQPTLWSGQKYLSQTYRMHSNKSLGESFYLNDFLQQPSRTLHLSQQVKHLGQKVLYWLFSIGRIMS